MQQPQNVNEQQASWKCSAITWRTLNDRGVQFTGENLEVNLQGQFENITRGQVKTSTSKLTARQDKHSAKWERARVTDLSGSELGADNNWNTINKLVVAWMSGDNGFHLYKEGIFRFNVTGLMFLYVNALYHLPA